MVEIVKVIRFRTYFESKGLIEWPFTNMERMVGQLDLTFGQVKFEMSIRLNSGVKKTRVCTLGPDWDLDIKFRSHSMEMAFKVKGLDEITKGMSVNREGRWL